MDVASVPCGSRWLTGHARPVTTSCWGNRESTKYMQGELVRLELFREGRNLTSGHRVVQRTKSGELATEQEVWFSVSVP
jgi:hypothetical protein